VFRSEGDGRMSDPDYDYEYDDESPWTNARLVWAAIAAVCVVALLGNFTVWLLLRGPDSDSAGQQSGGASGHVDANTSSGERPGSHVPQPNSLAQTAMGDCRSRWQQQRLPLRAAQASIQQWRVHVRAMNQLVAGEISPAQATTFWNQTRKGAMHRIMQFEQASARYSHSAPTCDASAMQATVGLPTSSRDCVRAALAGDQVLSAAEKAIGTWQHHVHHMEMLRTGQLSAAQASRMWQMSWQAGRRELVEYGHATNQALYLRCG
jgi:hypothetical protein